MYSGVEPDPRPAPHSPGLGEHFLQAPASPTVRGTAPILTVINRVPVRLKQDRAHLIRDALASYRLLIPTAPEELGSQAGTPTGGLGKAIIVPKAVGLEWVLSLPQNS